MHIEKFCFAELKKQVEEIELDVEKIEFISNEILRCKEALIDIRSEMKNIAPTEIKISLKATNAGNPLIEMVNCNEELKQAVKLDAIHLCSEKIFEEYNEYLERAELLHGHYKQKLETRVTWGGFSKTDNFCVNESGPIERIVWFWGKEKLLEIFSCLNKNEILPKYSKEEILVHFNDEKQTPFYKGINHFKKLNWHDSDNSFSIFVDELAKRGAIKDVNKYKVFEKHFLNKNGEPFKDLTQKKNYSKICTQTANLIEQILNSINISIIIFLYMLPSLSNLLFDGVTETLSYFMII
ncbi:MAG: hypothetical protein M1480_20570 [Bacteroidetes bacterium]|nr:hypothetical protein [Bacteroidota bacterium]MCL5031405.1 hypothetical protein [Bacteroidota bacterium]